jgi:glutathione synthase/RimK-type ligase-like ATP-grasp enzyme
VATGANRRDAPCMPTPRQLIVMDLEVDAPRDTSVAIIEEALGRGLLVDVCDAADLHFTTADAAAESRRVRAAGTTAIALGDSSATPLDRYRAILDRNDPPFTVETLYATLLLEHAPRPVDWRRGRGGSACSSTSDAGRSGS